MDEMFFKKVNVKVQPKSSFDLSFQNLLTTKVGTITPVLCEEVIPNETIDLRAAIQAQLPPLASDTFMRCDLKYEAFFVPHRLVMKGYEEWLVPGSELGSDVSATFVPHVPQISLTTAECAAGTLADYLGVKSDLPRVPSSAQTAVTSASTIAVNAMPFLAYHRIYNDWYRNSLVQKSIYRSEGLINTGTSHANYSAMDSQSVVPNERLGYVLTGTSTAPTATSNTKSYYDGVLCTDLRQRNFGIDRFTSSTPSAQNGEAQGLKLSDIETNAGFTIGQLRAANSIQVWLERNSLAGNRLVDYVKANYGANLSDGVAQRSLLLGSGSFAVYSKGIYETSIEKYQGSVEGVSNPFKGSPGAQFGSAFASGNEYIIDHFTANEPGYVFVMCTLVPKVNYGSGIDRKLIRYMNNSRTDMANPLLQNTGNEPIWQPELSTWNAYLEQGLTGDQQIFGYQEKYADWKSKQNEIHGLIREKNGFVSAATNGDSYVNPLDAYNGSLSMFASQSNFGRGYTPEISTSFLQIPTDYLNNVTAVEDDLSNYGCWIDTYFDFKVSMPLARNSIPSLQDPAYEHGYDVTLDRGGKRL